MNMSNGLICLGIAPAGLRPKYPGKGNLVNALVSSSLLAASMLLGQAEAPRPLQLTQGRSIVQDSAPTPLQSGQPMPAPAPQRPFLGWWQRDERPILSKMQNWFKRDHDKEGQPFSPLRPGLMRETVPPPLYNTPPSNDFPRKLPNNPTGQVTAQPTSLAKAFPSAPVYVEQPNVPQPYAQQPYAQQPYVPKIKTPILPQFAERIGRDEKFEWITGQLEVENNNYVIYYATPETVDKYHGRVFLVAPQNEMSKYRRGDLISVRGQLMQRQTPQGMVPIYRAEQVSPVDSARQ